MSLVDHDGNNRTAVAAAIAALCGFFPSLLLHAYNERTRVQFAPIVDINTSVDYSLIDSVMRCFQSPKYQFGHGVLAVLAIILAVAVPFTHMLAVVWLSLAKLTKQQVIDFSTRLEIIAEWASLDVFLLALIPVSIEMGPMTSTLAKGKVTNEPSMYAVTMTIGIITCAVAHYAHWMFLRGCHDRVGGHSPQVENKPLLESEADAKPLTGTETKATEAAAAARPQWNVNISR